LDQPKVKRIEIEPGTRWGRLTYVKEAEKDKHGKRVVLVACDCGKQKSVSLRHLRNGAILSCGCLNKELASERFTVHGMAGSRVHVAWMNMISRCNRGPGFKFYKNYRGRGIKVHEEWRSFPAFLAYVLAEIGPPPSPEHSLDRFPDRNGDYAPGNVRWATQKQQMRNTTANRMITFRGETLCMAEWSEKAGISYGTLSARIDRHGWPIDRALTTPVKSR
jgi:hypothetical protein